MDSSLQDMMNPKIPNMTGFDNGDNLMMSLQFSLPSQFRPYRGLSEQLYFSYEFYAVSKQIT